MATGDRLTLMVYASQDDRVLRTDEEIKAYAFTLLMDTSQHPLAVKASAKRVVMW
jgi:hypothetical protein